MDDEYFLRMLSMKAGVTETPSVLAVRGSAFRALTNSNKTGFRKSLFRSLQEVPVYTSAGIYLGHGTSYNVDLVRLCKVIERTTRGLYFNEYRVRLRDDLDCLAFATEGFANPNSEISAQLLKYAAGGKCRDFGRNVFTCWNRSVPRSDQFTILGVSGL